MYSPRLSHQPKPLPAGSRAFQKIFAPLDNLLTRLYGSRWNPVHYSGALAVFFFLALLVSGLYLFLFYSIGTPYKSVVGIQEQVWAGRWVRALHRYASDAVIVTTVLHVFKMTAAGKSWGPRALAWITGVFLVGLILLTGWTGMIMVWDVQGYLVAYEGARLLDLLPIFSQPISRSFIQQDTMPTSFFFMNLFLHVALPLGVAFGMWLHTSRVARPRLLPERDAMLTAAFVALAVSIAWPAPLLPGADLLAIPGRLATDMLFAFWVPVSREIPPLAHAGLWAGGFALLVSAPWWLRPRDKQIMPSQVDIERCTGCTQCYEDCPYDAIQMVKRTVPSKLSEFVAQVDEDVCVSCGICSASCAPMGVGPPLYDGRSQLRQAEAFVAEHAPRHDQVVVLGCTNEHAKFQAQDGVLFYPTGCSGAVHTSIIELLLKRGVGGVYMLTCPPSSCTYREGPKWLELRVHHDREAELHARVDKTRVKIGGFAAAERAAAVADIRAFVSEIAKRATVTPDMSPLAEPECEPEAKS